MDNFENRMAQIDNIMTKANAQPQSKALQRMAEVESLMQNEEAMRREDEIAKLNATAAQTEKKIGEKEIRDAYQILTEYKAGKQNFDARMVENEEYYNNTVLASPSQEGINKVYKSSWLFNALSNKHADFMDNYPEPSVLPREKGDTQTAQTLSSILPVIYEHNKHKRTYSKCCWSKLIYGTAAYGVFWDPTKLNGLGDVSITKANLLNMFWKPGIEDIQDSPNLFVVTEIDNEQLEAQYPALAGKLGGSASGETQQFNKEDTVDESKNTNVFEWYYKRKIGGKTVVHYVKWAADTVLYATENETQVRSDGNGNIIQQSLATTGLYAHGKYPYVLDVLFPMEGVPTGSGYIDKLKDAQEQIDILNNAILVNAKQSAVKRWIVSNGTTLNMNEFTDWTLPIVHTTDGNFNSNTATEITTAPMSDIVIATLDRKVDELKETGSNRDFSNGATSSGVTSGAAIAALQEAGNKTSRDAISGTYDAQEEIAGMVIELIRQFYNTPRCFRITGQQSEMQFTEFSNEGMKMQQTEFGGKIPLFDIKIKAHKQNPFSKVANNQDMLNLYSMGFFNPQMADQSLACLENLDIEGKDKLIERISQNQTLSQKVTMMQPILAQLAMWMDSANGTQITQQLAAQGLLDGVDPNIIQVEPQAMSAKSTNSLGEMNNGSGHPTVDKAKKAVNQSSEIK